MKNLVKFFAATIVLGGVAVLASSCDPDEVDAFADGYRKGYYGTYYAPAQPSTESPAPEDAE